MSAITAPINFQTLISICFSILDYPANLLPCTHKLHAMPGTGSLAADLKLFLDKHMEILAGDEPILKMIGTVLRSNEKARGIPESFLIMERVELTECLSNRVSNPQTAAALACNTTDTIGRAIFLPDCP